MAMLPAQKHLALNSVIVMSRDMEVTNKSPASRRFAKKLQSSSFAICVDPQPALFLYDLLLFLQCSSVLVNCYFQVSFNLKVIL